MNSRAASPKDSDAILALGKLPNSWRGGSGRFATEDLRLSLQSEGKPSNQLVERDGAVLGFAWMVATGSDASRIHVIAAAGPVFLALLDWACGSCRQLTVLRTSALVAGEASARGRISIGFGAKPRRGRAIAPIGRAPSRGESTAKPGAGDHKGRP